MPPDAVTVPPLRLLAVSHPSVLPVNQAVYATLARRGWDPLVVVPSRWRHEYEQRSFAPRAAEGMERRLIPLRAVLAGRPQRHVYVTRPARLVRRLRPQIAFVEQEALSLAALQWGRALSRLRIPFGVQADDNIDRPRHRLVERTRSWVLRNAAFVAARSPRACELTAAWGARGLIALVPHHLLAWDVGVAPSRSSRPFTVGFAGRLVPEKGVWDLIAAADWLGRGIRVLLVGDGPLRSDLERMAPRTFAVQVWSGLPHERMPEAYAEMDVLVLPSRTTTRWSEQFGRVLAEASSCGVPVVGSRSGEIPWVVESTGGGYTFPEGDVAELARILGNLRVDPERRKQLGRQGRQQANAMFGVEAVADALDSLLRSALRARAA